MECIMGLSLPGGSEWLCLLTGLVLMVGFVLLVVLVVVYLTKGRTSSPPHVPKTCNSCGRGNLADARFCSYCGQAIP